MLLEVLEDSILEKPASEDDARQMLRRLSGKTHTVYTAVVLLLPKRSGTPSRTHRLSVRVLICLWRHFFSLAR